MGQVVASILAALLFIMVAEILRQRDDEDLSKWFEHRLREIAKEGRK